MQQTLLQCNLIDTQPFSLNGYVCLAKVLKVYDADTLTVALEYLGKFYRFSIRVSGIDTCELRSKNKQAKDLGYLAKNELLDILTDSRVQHPDGNDFFEDNNVIVELSCQRFDKYGRLLGVIKTLSGVNVGEHLIANGYAYRYLGGTKLTEQEQIDLLSPK